jgi:hypothetical protein
MENDFNPFLDMNPFSHTDQLNNMMAVGSGVGHGPLQQPLMVSRRGPDGMLTEDFSSSAATSCPSFRGPASPK